MTKKIRFNEYRDFGQVFGNTFGYLKQNFKSFFGTILVLAGPFFLLSNIASSFLLKYSFGSMTAVKSPVELLSEMIAPLSISIFLSLIGFSVYTTIVNEHTILNDELPDNEHPNLSMISSRFFGSYWRNLGNMFMILIALFAAYIIVGGFFVITAIGTASVGVLGIFFIFILMIFILFFVLPIVFYLITAIIYTGQVHKLGFFSASRKVIKYLRGNFWRTWLLSFCGGIVCYMLMMVAYIPIMVMMMMSTFSRLNLDPNTNSFEQDTPVLLIIITTIVGLLIIGIYSIYMVMMNMQCAANEEKHEGKNILQKIEQL